MLSWFRRKPPEKVEEPLLEWTDEDGHVMPYVFRSCARADAPLLLLLHGRGFHERPSKYRSRDYHVLAPLDQYGLHKRGSWFLGENGDFFTQRMLIALIQSLMKEHGLEKLYIWGSSMGAYAGLLLGLLLEAQAVFSHIPQTNMRDSAWSLYHKKAVDAVFGQDSREHEWRDLKDCINGHRGIFPLFFLSFNRFDNEHNYNAEQMTPFVNCLNEKGLNYLLLVHPRSGHSLNGQCSEQIRYFSTYEQDINDNYEGQRPAPD